ncbi:Gp49 family protein [Delftia tsuruhatensis]|uniref:Gp49 family protein n=2 Tax=Delftia tsuruhatensis TaxID=180282 RepID=UPI0039BD2F55
MTAPRVTPADLQANIVHTEIVKHISPSGQVLRWAVLTTRNGFAVTGRPSASVSSSNDNEEIGKKVAIDNAMQELWPLMGYELRSKLAGINDPSKAEQVLGEVLSVVQHYLPPDGGTVHEAMDKIIGLVDPWPLGAASAAAALLSSAGVDSGHTDSTAPAFRAPTPLEVAAEEYARAEQNLSMASLRARRASEEVRDALSAESDAMHARATALGKLTEAALPKHPYAGQS